MHRWAVILSALSLCVGSATVVAGTASADNDNDPYTLSDGHANAGMGGVVPVRGMGKPGGGGGGPKNPNLTWHGGPVQSAGSTVIPIFWGTGWNTTPSGLKINYLTDFYQGVGGSGYMKSNTEYPGTTSAKVSATVTWGGSFTDLSAAPSRAPSTSSILAEVAKMTNNKPVAGAYYPVYIDNGRGNAGYCAWHSAGTIGNNVGVQFGFFFNLDNDPGCDPDDTQTGNPQGIAALANVSGHELSEMTTDPLLNAWYDGQGNENSDKCAWTFDPGYLANFGGHSWKIQGNWSNAAYNNHQSGYANGGCISHS
jgi:hypothetical protein